MKKKIGNWLLRTAYSAKNFPWLMPAVLGVLAKMGLVKYDSYSLPFIHYRVLVGHPKAGLRLSVKTGEIMYWYDEENDFYYEATGLRMGWMLIVLTYLEDKLFDVHLKDTYDEHQGIQTRLQ